MTKAALFTQVLIAGCAVLLTGFAIRAGFRVFRIPIAEDVNRARPDVSPAIAVPNPACGSGQQMAWGG